LGGPNEFDVFCFPFFKKMRFFSKIVISQPVEAQATEIDQKIVFQKMSW